MDFAGRSSRCREMSPDRAKVLLQQRVIRPTLKKVQVVYYLSRNGHLEHPHYMEVTHLANQQLRLKDIMERLTVLRGKGVPSLYSWSCKRSYRNGYVWNDLGENDIIYPCEGAEYVLKGSELIEGCTVSPPPSNTSKVFEDCDLVANKPLLTRNSMLLSLIACGGSGSFRKSAPAGIAKPPPPRTVTRNGGSGGGGLHKGVVCKAAAKVAVEEDEMISCMSENPRFGNLQSEEKEYFSGSIVESMSTEERIQVEPGLKKSSSHNEER
ncbi:Protein UPSTREAM OF FLC [Forsythia ovata]|uniref:Protein UPSTREAM OF FLC n=1 Tax=Forsythia ovata TaxID=205694 RepID=A0ABD1WPL4_9LAMI